MEERLRILLVEDDQRLAGLIRDYLQMQGFEVLIEERGDTACRRILKENPDLLILDLMLPGKGGHAVCQSVRAKYHGPILILTACEDDMEQVVGLELGADDYVKKPIEPRVLLARIRALLRRVENDINQKKSTATPHSEPSEDINFGGLRICRSSHTVFLDNELIELTTTEFKLLCFLAANAGRALEREMIFSAIRGIDYDGLDRSIDIAVSRLRKKLEVDPSVPKRIKTLWGQGYVFVKDAW
ncbi:winged helix-turn-helix domain-containing protein [Psychromonas ossibalaenae]|uniref:winged helix-turn-helix domain-containing protein n=1 Tax=Psychromonas ossibalaenae TaxID=444922 RepID=UPI00035FFA07|nr:winged helix-turn-helix domain-containing protein [Psychromonas ossibalaenae]